MSKKRETSLAQPADSKAALGSTVLVPCGCRSPYQDLAYGAGRRVANRGKENKAACTVCGLLRGMAS